MKSWIALHVGRDAVGSLVLHAVFRLSARQMGKVRDLAPGARTAKKLLKGLRPKTCDCLLQRGDVDGTSPATDR